MQQASSGSACQSLSFCKFLLPWIICATAAVFYCYEYYLRVTPGVMEAELVRAFAIDSAGFGALAAFYYHAYTPLQLPVGVLMDRYGPRNLLTLACLICAIGSFIFAYTTQLTVAYVGRFLVGFGSAFAFIGVLKLARAWLPPERFAMMSGITSALGIIGALSGNITMTSMLNSLGWRNTIVVSAIAGVVLTIVIYLIIRDKPYYSTSNGVAETKTTFSQLFRDCGVLLTEPGMWIVGLVGCLQYLPTSTFSELWASVYFQQAWGFSPMEAAYAVSTIFVGWGIAAPFAGYISDKINRRVFPMLAGTALAAIIISILIYVPHIPKSLTFVLLFIFGASYSVEVIVFAYACDIAPERTSGTALAITNMLVMIGGSIFQPVVGKILQKVGHPTFINGEPIYNLIDYRIALSVLPIGLVVATLLLLRLRESRQRV